MNPLILKLFRSKGDSVGDRPLHMPHADTTDCEQYRRLSTRDSTGWKPSKTRQNMFTHLVKSSLQYSFPSRLKHFSERLLLQSAHFTHFACQARSKTLKMNRSSIGISQPAQRDNVIMVYIKNKNPEVVESKKNHTFTFCGLIKIFFPSFWSDPSSESVGVHECWRETCAERRDWEAVGFLLLD